MKDIFSSNLMQNLFAELISAGDRERLDNVLHKLRIFWMFVVFCKFYSNVYFLCKFLI